LPQQRIVAREGEAHGLGMFFPESGRTLDIGEEKGDGSGG
jgi:hypothetical protein